MNLFKLIVNIVFCIIAGILVYLAPPRYDYTFCVIILVLFIFQNIIYFIINKRSTKNATNFDFFFMFSFGMTNFIYPIFYKPINPNVSLFNIPFSSKVICKATAVAYLGYSLYILGITIYRRNTIKISNYINSKQQLIKKPKKELIPNFGINNIFFGVIFIIAILSFVGYIATGGLEELQKVYSGRNGDLTKVGIYSYFNNIFVICCNLLAIFLFFVNDKKTKFLAIAFLSICSILLLSTGSRTVVLGIGLILVSVYGRFVRRITMPMMLLLLLAGSLFMTVVQQIRGQEISADSFQRSVNNNVEFDSFFDVFLDLIINNRNLYVLVDFADRFHYVYFLNSIADISSPIPGLFGYISSNIGVPVELISGGGLPTFLEFGTKSSWGLGTNLVGEAYVSLGIYGVIIIMFLLGFILKRLYKASEHNVYAFVCYYLLVSHAIFFPRSYFLYQPRMIVWSILLVFIVIKISGSLYQRKIIKK